MLPPLGKVWLAHEPLFVVRRFQRNDQLNVLGEWLTMPPMFIQYISTDPVFYFGWIVLAAFSICCHEYAHAYVALRVGDDTAARDGHLTLNPLVQMGFQSMLMLVFFGIAWGAVPVSLRQQLDG